MRRLVLAALLVGSCAIAQSTIAREWNDPSGKSSASAGSEPARVASKPVTNSVQPVGPTDAKCCDSKPEKDWWHELRTDPVATFTALLTVVTALLWWATRRLVKGAEDTAERQLRAYLFIDEAQLIVSDAAATVASTIRNFGQTPAKRIRNTARITIQPAAYPFAFEPLEHVDAPGNAMLGPRTHLNSTQPVQYPQDGYPLLALLESGATTVYFQSLITYEDFFGKTRTTNYTAKTSKNLQGHWAFAPLPMGNDAT
jgi:hypothetical protein